MLEETIKRQLYTMLTLQNQINCKIDPDWITRGRPWYRCIWIECAELMDHAGYKWWKDGKPDMAQVKLEIVDIWHFMLSQIIEQPPFMGMDDFPRYIYNRFANPLPIVAPFDPTETLVSVVCNYKKVPAVSEFLSLMLSVDMTFDDLFVGYIGKNVLNNFRQNNGYKDGTYHKLWGGREDNEHLVELSELLDSNNYHFPAELYRVLELRYKHYF